MKETSPMITATDPDLTCIHTNCQYEVETDKSLCRLHAGGGQLSPTRAKKQSTYDLAETEYLSKLNNRIKEKGYDPARHSLKKEIGITEVLIEETLNGISNRAELLLTKDQLSSLLAQIESLKKTDLQMDKETKNLIARDEMMGMGQEMLNIIGKHLTPLSNKYDDVQRAMERVADDFDTIFNPAG